MAMSPEMLDAEGFLIVRSDLPSSEMARIRVSADSLDVYGAGTRNLLLLEWCRDIVHALRDNLSRSGFIAPDAMAVQCTLFSKTPSLNWKVALHQDLAVPVAAKVEHPALSGWSEKEGVAFVQPPAASLQGMLAVRLHLDRCMSDDGPLHVVPRSHRHGRLDRAKMRALDRENGRVACVADAGDLLLMRPLLLHASSKAQQPTGSRRVMHFLFGPAEPGFGLQWSIAI